MIEITNRLEQLLKTVSEYVSQSSELELTQKTSPEKWSKKEILGHLIDSAINNLQRFTEIQFEEKPYKIRKYNQDGLVKSNDYQNAKPDELVNFWLSLNNRISNVIKNQTEKTLDYKIEISSDNIADLRFLIQDYVDHMEHHVNQITKNTV